MAAQRVQWLRNTWANLVALTLPVGMIVVDTTNSRLVVHDGVTAGGTPAPMRKSKSGAPTTTDLTTSAEWGIFKDTAGGGVVLAYNDGGVIKKVALT